MIASLHQLLKEQGYTLIQNKEITSISRSKAGPLILMSIFIFIGGLTIYISLDNSHSYAHFIGLAIIAIPFAYDTLRYPSFIRMEPYKQELMLRKGFFISKKYNFHQIESIDVDEDVLSGDTSPFKEGNKDYIYSFWVTIDGKKHKLLKIQYRKAMDEEVKTFIDFFDKVLNSKTTLIR